MNQLRVAVNCAGEGDSEGWQNTVDFVVEAERLGVAFCWSAEAWGWDGISPLAYLAGKTSRITLGTGILPVYNRTPVTVAMTALALSSISGGRFVLGLGASGPRMVEGLHGQEFHRPLRRLEETIAILRQAFSGERISYQGEMFSLPLRGSEGGALRLAAAARHRIPIYLATLSRRALELTGRLADGWLGTAFVPEAADAYLGHLGDGAAAAGRQLSDLDLQEGGEVAFGDDVSGMVAKRKKDLAFTLGGMGTASVNFYNDAYSRQGFAETAAEVKRLWVDGRRDEAAAAVPDELVLKTTLIGTEDMVKERIRVIRQAGINTLRLYPAGNDLAERVATLGRAMDLVAAVNDEIL